MSSVSCPALQISAPASGQGKTPVAAVIDASSMVGIIAALAKMQAKLGGLGLQWAEFSEGKLRGHTFHYSIFDKMLDFDSRAEKYPYKKEGEGVIRSKGLDASYIHCYFPSNSAVVAQLLLENS